MSQFKYDVAFSFLGKDEDVATRICDHLEGRVSSFIYSRKQEDLAGTDGQEVFSRVFEEEARVVVIVLGAGWGERGWTLIEKTAIQNRGLREGWDFLQILPVGDGTVIPKFIPRAHIYFDWNRWGIDGASSVIEAHVQRQGGDPKEPTFEGAATKKKRELDLARSRDSFKSERNGDGIKWVRVQAHLLFTRLQEKAAASSLGLQTDQGQNRLAVNASGVRMAVTWQQPWADVLKDSNLRIALQDTSDGRTQFSEAAKPIGKPFYFFVDLDQQGKPAWRGEDRWFSTEQLAEHLLKRMVEHAKAEEW